MKIVHTTVNEIARIVSEFQNEIRRNNLSREICVVTAVKKDSNETTIQTIKRIPKRVTATLKGRPMPEQPHLIRFYNPKAINHKTGELGAFRSIVASRVTSAIVRDVLYVADQTPNH